VGLREHFTDISPVSGPEGARVTSLSIIYPAYNEEPNIETAVRRALEVAESVAEEAEIIVVDDGSRDGTAEVAYGLVQEHYPRVRLLRHPRNRGYGAALRSGFGHARFDYVFYTDADNQFDVSELAYFLPLIRTADVVVGFRVYRYDSVLRLAASWIYNHLVSILFRVKVRDVDCAFKLLRREVLDKITIERDDFFVDTELIVKARKWNFQIVEKGVRHYPRIAGETTVRPSDIPRTLRTIAVMWQRVHRPTLRQVESAADNHARAIEETIEATPTAR
jgi:glycosyltransferase involved in cell wall biosynthesis